MSSNNMYNILNTLKSLEPTPEQKVKAEAKRIYESVEAQGSITEGVGVVEAKLRQKFAEVVAEGLRSEKVKMPNGQRPKGIGWVLKQAGEQSGKDYSVWERKFKLVNKQGVAEDAKPDFLDLDHDGNEKESMKKAAKDNVRVHKGTYGTSYDPSDEEKKTKPKHVPKAGQKGRPKQDKPAKANLPADPFGRTTGEVPKGKKGTKIKGAGNIDTVDEVITKKTSAGNIIKDFQKSKNAKFAGKSKEQRKNQALGAYYGMHPEKSNKSESLRESLERVERKVILEANLKELMKQHHMTMDEMLEQLRNEAQTYKQSGHMSEMLRDCMEIHNHNKNFSLPHPAMADEGTELPKPQGTLGTIGSAIKHGAKQVGKAIVGKSDDELLHDLHKDVNGPDAIDRNFPSAHDELNEIAKLAGLTDEGNAFGQAVQNTPKGEHIKVHGKDTGEIKHEDAMPDQEGVSLNELAKLAGLNVHEQNIGPSTGGMEEGQMSDDDIVNCIDDALEDGAPYEQALMSACEECGCEIDYADQVYRASGPDSEHIPPVNFGQDDWHDSLDGEREDPHGWDLDEADAPVVEPKTKPVNDAEHIEYRSMRGSTMGPGEGDPGEKRMYPPSGGAAPGADNGMTEPARKMPIKDGVKESALESRLAAEYASIKKKA